MLKINHFKALFLITFLAMSPLAFGTNCFQADQKNIKLKWTAYKTPLKVGVSGLLKDISVTTNKKQSLEEIIKSTSFSITTGPKSVDTKNPARDGKISKAFFSGLKDQGKITGKIVKFENKKLLVSITMNGVQKNLPLTAELKGTTLIANGHMDILDFMMSDALQSLNKACFAKHEGKTWSDVALELNVPFITCKK